MDRCLAEYAIATRFTSLQPTRVRDANTASVRTTNSNGAAACTTIANVNSFGYTAAQKTVVADTYALWGILETTQKGNTTTDPNTFTIATPNSTVFSGQGGKTFVTPAPAQTLGAYVVHGDRKSVV